MSDENTTPSQTQVQPQQGNDVAVRRGGVSVSDFSGLANVLSAVINASESGLYYEPSCPVCSCTKRSEVEAFWRSTDILASDRVDKVVQYLLAAGETISRDAVSNHFKSHVDKGEIELRKAEYIAKLSNLSATGLATIDHVKIAMAAVMECLTCAGTVVPDKHTTTAKALEVKAKMVTSLVKTWTDLLSLQAKMYGELEDRGEIVSMPKEAFTKVFDNALNAAKSKEDRDAIHAILNGLQAMYQQ